MSKSFKSKVIVFTAYGKEVEDDPEGYLKNIQNKCDWVLGQLECCPETKKLHIQGMAYCKETIRWGFMGTTHKEKCNDPLKSIEYCSKEESRVQGPWEFGNRPTFNIKGQKEEARRKLLAEKNKLLLEKTPIQLIEEGIIPLSSLPGIVKAKNMYGMINPGEPKQKQLNLWIHGEPGCGKTWFAKNVFKQSLYEKAQNKWFDGFQGEDYVLIDDFDKQGTGLGHYLKIWADRYFGFKSETKGGTIQPNFKRLIITSNYTPEQLWGGPFGDDILVKAIERRFFIVEMVGRKFTKRIPDLRGEGMEQYYN